MSVSVLTDCPCLISVHVRVQLDVHVHFRVHVRAGEQADDGSILTDMLRDMLLSDPPPLSPPTRQSLQLLS